MTEALWGVIIGAIAAILGGAITQFITYYFDKKKGRRKKLCETYEAINKAIIITTNMDYYNSDEFKRLSLEAVSKVDLYTDYSIRKSFSDVMAIAMKTDKTDEDMKEYQAAIDIMTLLMRTELNK